MTQLSLLQKLNHLKKSQKEQTVINSETRDDGTYRQKNDFSVVSLEERMMMCFLKILKKLF